MVSGGISLGNPLPITLGVQDGVFLPGESIKELRSKFGIFSQGNKTYKLKDCSALTGGGHMGELQITLYYDKLPDKEFDYTIPAGRLEVMSSILFGSMINQTNEDLRIRESIRMAKEMILAIDRDLEKSRDEDLKKLKL